MNQSLHWNDGILHRRVAITIQVQQLEAHAGLERNWPQISAVLGREFQAILLHRWWFQPNWNTLVELDHFPKQGWNKNIFESSTRLHTFHLCIGKTTSTAICHVSMANNIILLIWGDRVDFSQIVEKQSINHICFKNHQEMTMFLFTYEYIKSVVQLIQGLTQSLHF